MNFFVDVRNWLGGYPFEYAPLECNFREVAHVNSAGREGNVFINERKNSIAIHYFQSGRACRQIQVNSLFLHKYRVCLDAL